MFPFRAFRPILQGLCWFPPKFSWFSVAQRCHHAILGPLDHCWIRGCKSHMLNLCIQLVWFVGFTGGGPLLSKKSFEKSCFECLRLRTFSSKIEKTALNQQNLSGSCWSLKASNSYTFEMLSARKHIKAFVEVSGASAWHLPNPIHLRCFFSAILVGCFFNPSRIAWGNVQT